jgi:hypothetical protein
VAEKCLAVSSARINVLARSDIHTPLGRLIYGQVINEGLVVVAGPNKSQDLRRVLQGLADFGAKLTFVDGALNRIAPMVETNGIILATGAAKETNIDKLVLETKSIDKIFNLPQISLNYTFENTIVLREDPSVVLAKGPPSLLDIENLQIIATCPQLERITVVIPGITSFHCLHYLLKFFDQCIPTIVFRDPVKLMLTGDLPAAVSFIELVQTMGGTVGYIFPLQLIAVTINPFYPKFRYEFGDYQAEYIDAKRLYIAMAQALSVPVYDIFVHGVEEIAEKIRHLWLGASAF